MPNDPSLPQISFSDGPGANVAIGYMYRDGSNCKRVARVVLAGRIENPAPIAAALNDGEFFLAAATGLRPLHLDFDKREWIEEIDHPWHTIVDISHTDEPATMTLCAAAFLAAFPAKPGDWNEDADADFIRATIAAAPRTFSASFMRLADALDILARHARGHATTHAGLPFDARMLATAADVAEDFAMNHAGEPDGDA